MSSYAPPARSQPKPKPPTPTTATHRVHGWRQHLLPHPIEPTQPNSDPHTLRERLFAARPIEPMAGPAPASQIALPKVLLREHVQRARLVLGTLPLPDAKGATKVYRLNPASLRAFIRAQRASMRGSEQ